MDRDSRPPAEHRTDAASTAEADLATHVHGWIVVVIVGVMLVDGVFLALSEQWLSAFLALTIAAVVVLAYVLGDNLSISVPSEFQILALVFVFAALFLGEVRSFYDRFWWWDILLHTSSGLLLGILGFLLVHLLNESERVDLAMQPRFVALFAFLFAVAVGALWEVFEFSMDRLFGMRMQKPMLGDDSGLTDTMWDLIVDTLGAVFISGLGWRYMIRREHSFIDVWIRKFIDRNPRLFRRKQV